MLKRNFYSDPRHIGHFKGYKNKYKVNEEYQREEVWSKYEKQYFIDTIIQRYPIPQVFIRVLPDGLFEIVDGQQRLTTIWEFLKDGFELSLKYSGPKYAGKKYSKLTDLEKIDFEGTRIPVIWLDHYTDEDIRSLFRRLQSGKQLTTGEKLNAFPGTITLIMRELANHPLFSKVNFSTRRYRPLQLIAQTFLIINNGITDIGASKLYDFFDNNKNANQRTPFYKKSKKVLNFMNKVIKDEKLIEMSKPS